MISIFGSGFGLYGHLPAVVELGHSVSVPARYQPAFDSRKELTLYRSSVQFINDESRALKDAAVAILARRPLDNGVLARQAIASKRPVNLVIEKPLAAEPSAAILLHEALNAERLRYATPYLFEYCDWARECRQRLRSGNSQQVTVDWQIKTSKSAGTWKNLSDSGGGSLNYYFIHFIPLADFLLGDYRLIEFTATQNLLGDTIRMVATNSSSSFSATLSTGCSDFRFVVTANGAPSRETATPFGAVPEQGLRDPRIDILKHFYANEVFGGLQPQIVSRRKSILIAWKDLYERLRQNTSCSGTSGHPSGHRQL